MKSYKPLFCLILVTLVIRGSVYAQSLTVYTSPHNISITQEKVLASIDSNDYKFLANRSFKAESKIERKFSGEVTIIEFEIPEVYELAACEPTAMLDMPLKVIIWKEEGDVYIGFMRADELKKRFLATHCEDLLKVLNRAMIRVVNDAVRDH